MRDLPGSKEARRGRLAERVGSDYIYDMDDHELIRRLGDISEAIGRTDKQIQYGNLACKVQGLLTKKSGRLTPEETNGLREIGAKVTELAEGAGIKVKPLRSKDMRGDRAIQGRAGRDL